MKLEKHIKNWVDNKLISSEQAQAIKDYEANQGKRSWIVIGAAGVGIVAMVLGIISIIAANWEYLGDNLKLASFFALQAVLGYNFYKRRDQDSWIREVLLAIFAFLFLGGIGLIGQIYHLQSDGYSALFFWCLITLGLALIANWRLLPDIWHIIFAIAVSIWAGKYFNLRDGQAFFNICLSVALFFHAIGIYRLGSLGLAEKFRESSFRYSTLVMAFFTVIANFQIAEKPNSYAYRGVEQALTDNTLFLPLVSIIFPVLAALTNRSIRPKMYIYSYCATLFGFILYYISADLLNVNDSPLLACLGFILVWALVALTAVTADRKRIFDFASLIIAIRLLIVYFEVFGSLAMTGVGLVLTGALILGTLYVWHKYRSNLLGFLKIRL